MRSFLMFVALSIAVLLSADAYKFDGRYREEFWRDVKQHGRNLMSEAENVVRKALHR